MLNQLIHEALNSPVFAALGVAFLIAIVLAPALLSLAGLSPVQILAVINATLQALLQAIREVRGENPPPPPDK